MSRRIESMRRNSFATSAGLWAYVLARSIHVQSTVEAFSGDRSLFFRLTKNLVQPNFFYIKRYNGQSYDNPLDTSVSLDQASIYIEISVSGLPTSERWRYRRKCVFPEGLRSIRSLRFRNHISRVLTYFILA
jgi:hypothetical protein